MDSDTRTRAAIEEHWQASESGDSVSIMEFTGEHVVHESQYFADPFGSPAWRANLAEPMPGRTITRA
jgi:hypothetical protein